MSKENLISELKERLKSTETFADALTIEESNARTEKLVKETEGITKLNILIATTKDRRFIFNVLCQEFYKQIEMFGYAGKGKETWNVKVPRVDEGLKPVLSNEGNQMFDVYEQYFNHPPIVKILFEEDEKQISIGAKRQKLLDRSNADYIVFFDSDDFPKNDYVREIMKALEDAPDCIGFKIAMTTNGNNPQTCIHSLSNKKWHQNGDTFYRSVTHFNPVKKELALQVGFKDLRYGEDKDYSDRLTPLCKTETFIDKFLFDYRYSNTETHEIKYGIKK